MKEKFRKCDKCDGKWEVHVYSEDFASVYDSKCENGHRIYVYIGADDGKQTWDRFENNYPQVCDHEGQPRIDENTIDCIECGLVKS